MNKLIFFLKRPKILIVKGAAKGMTQEAVCQVLQSHFKMGQEVLIIAEQGFEFFIKHSRLPVLVVNGSIAQALEVPVIVQALTSRSYLILNCDDEAVRDLKNQTSAHVLTFGFSARADIRATEVGANFKISYQGNIVPVWLEKFSDKEQVYAALAAAAVGEALGLNLVEVSEALRGLK